MPVFVSTAQTALNQSTKDNPIIGWQSVVTPGNVTATTQAAGFPATNLADPATRPPWKSNVTGGVEYLTVVPGAGQTIDYLAIAGHNLFTIGSAPTVETCTNIGAGNWVAQVFPGISLTRDSPIIFRFVAGVYQGVRLRMAAGNAPQIVGALYVGALLVFERSVRIDTDHTPMQFGRKSKVISGMAESGNFLGRVVQTQWTEGHVDLNYMTAAWARAQFYPFYSQAHENPFFFSWWPSRYTADAGFVWLTEDATVPNDTMTDRYLITMKYQGIEA